MQKFIILCTLIIAVTGTMLCNAQTTGLPVTQNLQQYGTPFANVPDRRDVTIYQINMRAFSRQGNFRGIIARLDSIKALGVNVIYLLPIYPVGIVKTSNSPYCVKDYLAINKEFGTLTDLRALVDGAHKRNLAVVLDWVGNHTAWDNSWTKHKDWYLQDSAGNIMSPPGRGWNDVAQLNFNNKAMRLEMIKDMKYWVYAANIDGFRCDFADGPPADFWKQAIDSLKKIKTHKFLLLAEGTRSTNYTAGFDYNFGFAFFDNLKNIYSRHASVTTIDSLNREENKDASHGKQIVRYITNHDVNGSDGTPLQLFGGEQGSMAAFVVVAYMNSIPMIYDGQEVGMSTPVTFPFTTVKIKWDTAQGITATYKKIIAIRNSSKAIRRGKLTSYSNADICAFTKVLDKETVLVISNLRNEQINYALPDAIKNTFWQNAITDGKADLITNIELKPYQYLILKKINHS